MIGFNFRAANGVMRGNIELRKKTLKEREINWCQNKKKVKMIQSR